MKRTRSSRRRLGPECQRVAVLLPALPDGELRPADARRLEAHLAVCTACRREAELFMGLTELVRQASAVETPFPSSEAAVGSIPGDRGDITR